MNKTQNDLQWICYPILCLSYQRVTHSLDSVALSLFLPLFLFQSCSRLGLTWHVVFAANWHLHPCLSVSMVTNKMGPWTCQKILKNVNHDEHVMGRFGFYLQFKVKRKTTDTCIKKSKNAQINSIWVVKFLKLPVIKFFKSITLYQYKHIGHG